MSDYIGPIWWFIVAIGVLVTCHEFGHYWVAKRCGVKVLRFSVGFGKPLWMRRNKDGTEFAIAAIPLGGYVKMLDEREFDVAPSELHRAFNRQSPLRRIAIAAAGPIANIVLCVFFLWGAYVVGLKEYAPVVGAADGIASEAGIRKGDQILRIGDRTIQTWTDVRFALALAGLDRARVPVQVRDADGDTETRTLDLSKLPDGFDELQAPTLVGLTARYQLEPPIVNDIVAGSPAYGVLAEDDRILAIDGQPVSDYADIAPRVQALAARGGPGMIEVLREDDRGEPRRLAFPLTPRMDIDEATGKRVARIGVIHKSSGQMPAFDAVRRYGPIDAIPVAFVETWHKARDTIGFMGRMLTGNASTKYVSGPITTARAASATAELGLAWFLNFLAVLSISLAILNLLPIPLLDGGHLLYYLIELVKGSPLSERTMAAGQYVGLALLVGLMGLALFNDVFFH
ncbi:Membrane-associated zinc metalloprotease [Lysobacter dokdonensis DS-58]|uniref:Zinc metalloprotease n=1 Tax=Lysobacter dokdonensis DS-58 TaxID=1300345 RepID=A0A0A2WQY7_9GAMM|nr:RIP metalloprotease RseP [Lysobacter dokdonensis]KGQ20685.1 Membrane-associated zinc metalloprotease [Lysobacter dokdonensis DS-58]